MIISIQNETVTAAKATIKAEALEFVDFPAIKEFVMDPTVQRRIRIAAKLTASAATIAFCVVAIALSWVALFIKEYWIERGADQAAFINAKIDEHVTNKVEQTPQFQESTQKVANTIITTVERWEALKAFVERNYRETLVKLSQAAFKVSETATNVQNFFGGKAVG